MFRSTRQPPLPNSIKSNRSLNRSTKNSQSRSPNNVISSYLKQRWHGKERPLQDIDNVIPQKTYNHSHNNTSYGEHQSITASLQYYNASCAPTHKWPETKSHTPANNFNTGRLFQHYLFDEKRDSINLYSTKQSRSASKQIFQEEISATLPNSLTRPKKQLSSYLLQNKSKKHLVSEDNAPLKTLQSVHNSIAVPALLESVLEAQIELNQLKIEGVLGQGSYATVKLAKHTQTNQKYALKCYEKLKLADPQKYQIMKKEVSILRLLNHPSIIKLHGVVEDTKHVYLIMEYVSSLSLQSYAKSKFRMAEREAKHIFLQLMRAVCHLHNNNIAHRDIKTDNILMQSNNNIKLIDFGFATSVQMGMKSTVYCGTPNYMSPEMISKVPHNPLTSDIWSCGILIYTLLCGEHPFKAANNKELSKKIQVGYWKVPEGLQLTSGCQRVLKGCLEKSLDKRWTANKVIDDEWFRL